MCFRNSEGTSLSVTWDRPVAQGSEVVGYRIEAMRLEQLPSRELVAVPLSPAYDEGTGEIEAEITQGLRM